MKGEIEQKEEQMSPYYKNAMRIYLEIRYLIMQSYLKSIVNGTMSNYLSIYLSLSLSLTIYIYVCVCVCVCL